MTAKTNWSFLVSVSVKRLLLSIFFSANLEFYWTHICVVIIIQRVCKIGYTFCRTMKHLLEMCDISLVYYSHKRASRPKPRMMKIIWWLHIIFFFSLCFVGAWRQDRESFFEISYRCFFFFVLFHSNKAAQRHNKTTLIIKSIIRWDDTQKSHINYTTTEITIKVTFITPN